jgi:hypothetical protein
MAYIGKQPLVGNYTVLDAITATTTDTYALTKNSVAVFPQTPANCIVSLNGVIQAPTDSYTISGSDIVFASALTGSDSIDFITVLGDVLNVGTVSDGTIGLAKLSATGTKDATTFLRGDNTFASAGGTNTPAFEAYLGADQSVSTGTFTKAQISSEVFDTDECYDNSTNYRFTPTVAGKYFVYGAIEGRVASDDNHKGTTVAIYKNGTIYKNIVGNGFFDQISNLSSAYISAIIEMNGSTDYVELYGVVDGTSTPQFYSQTTNKMTFFGAYKIIE